MASQGIDQSRTGNEYRQLPAYASECVAPIRLYLFTFEGIFTGLELENVLVAAAIFIQSLRHLSGNLQTTKVT